MKLSLFPVKDISMSSIFSKIVNGDLPCYRVAEDDLFLAFLDVNPLVKGHVLVVPKQEVDYVFDLEDDLLAGLTSICEKSGNQNEKDFALRPDWCYRDWT